MLMNFAFNIVGTEVTCDKVSSDGRECANLIDTNFLTRKLGYVAEPFIKPPVNITFALPCNINVSHIVMDPYVGQQQCLQIDVFCATKPLPRTSHGKLRQTVKAFNSNPSLSDDIGLQAFFKVSSITSYTKSPFCFYNPRFNQRFSSTVKNPFEYQTRSEMRHPRADLLTSTSHITVKIVRTQRGSTPAVANIEIWGCVSSHMCKELKKLVEEKYTSFVTPVKMTLHDSTPSHGVSGGAMLGNAQTCNSDKSHRRKSSSPEKNDSAEIPDEFLDPLTCEVMTIPMLLPCGKNVDKTSLDRFSDSEANHGRLPRDPFTGIEFSGSIKPIPNGDLKSRIDSFLMTHSNVKSIATIPRTVCKGKSSSLLGKRKTDDLSASCSKHISSLVSGTNKKQKHSDSYEELAKSGSVECPPSTSKSKNTEISNANVSFHNGLEGNLTPITSVDVREKNSPAVSGFDSHMKAFKNEQPKSHNDRLRDSLNNALSSILKAVPSIKSTEQSTSSSDHNLCMKCDSVLGWEQITYATPCSHLICRKCLLSQKSEEISCSKCGKHFKKKSVVRSH